jgi:hypothetical protein
METASAGSLMPIIVALIGSQGLIAGAIALMAFRVGRMPSREETNALRDEVAANKVELKEEIAATKLELKEDIADTKLELFKAKTELRQEIAATKLELKEDIAATKLELKEDIADTKLEVFKAKAELRQEIADTKAELRQEIANTRTELEAKIDAAKDEVLLEIRRSHQQLILALVNHTHTANGQAVFTLPPETEPAPADN